ncbi:MAG: hydroxyacylglutathione hydrolase [Pseudomonadota bacterium]|nr:hydroxyacylglutathione hydrolase [Pseudomonadota bacterium]
MIEVRQISVLSDNYVYLITDNETKITACIDPSVSQRVIEVIEKENLNLGFILNTHHHYDHVGGNLELKERYNCEIIGNKNDKERIPGIDIYLKENDEFKLGNSRFKVLEISGHTVGHVGYYFKSDSILFCGDTLFSLGCGRLFEGSSIQMVESLLKIRSLPEDTKIFCGHEYTESNAEFALHLNPKDTLLKKKMEEIKKKRKKLSPTVPSELKEEKKLNPFLKFDDQEYLDLIGIENVSNEENFKKIRILKDNF